MGLNNDRRCYLAFADLSPKPWLQQMLIVELPGDKAQGLQHKLLIRWPPWEQ
jgi:hypothetical protein